MLQENMFELIGLTSSITSPCGTSSGFFSLHAAGHVTRVDQVVTTSHVVHLSPQALSNDYLF